VGQIKSSPEGKKSINKEKKLEVMIGRKNHHPLDPFRRSLLRAREKYKFLGIGKGKEWGPEMEGEHGLSLVYENKLKFGGVVKE